AGGIGFGGAYRVNRSPSARAAVAAAYKALEVPLAQVVVRALLAEPERYHNRVNLRPRTVQIDGEAADLVEVHLRWPKDVDAERRMFESLFGPKLVIATLFIDD